MTHPTLSNIVKGGLLGGLLWGWTVGLVHLAIGVALIVVLTAPPMTLFTAKSIAFEVSIATLFGLLLSPLLLLADKLGSELRARMLHMVSLAALWLSLERWVAVDPTRLQMWIAPSLVALLLVSVGALVARRWPVPLALSAVGLAPLLVSVPEIYYRWQGYGTVAVSDRAAATAGAPDVLFIVMDTTRAKSVSAYGYARKTTPVFDTLASQGALYTEANSSATWSLPAHASLFTGHYPSSHEGHDETRMLDDRLPTLAETMAKRGWQSLAFSANPYISDTYGLTRGFDWTDKAWLSGSGARQFSFIYRFIDRLGFAAVDKGGGQVVENLSRWMGERPANDPPAFVFVNFLEAHFPFNQLPSDFLYRYTDAPSSVLADASQTAFGVQFGRQLTDEEISFVSQPLVDMYDAGVTYTDHLVGQIVDLWRVRGTLDNTIVIIVGDHGEMMGEHGAFGHVTSMYQPDLHVPLMVRYPPAIAASTRVTEPVTTTGIFATVLDLLDQEPINELQAGSLLPGSDEPRGPVIAERFEEEMLASRFEHGTANGKGPLLQPRGRYRSYRENSFKYVESVGNGGPWLFNLETDPNEDHDLAASNPDKLAEMLTTLKALGFRPLDAPIGTVAVKAARSREECEMLVKLGYIDADGIEDCMKPM